MSFPRYATYRRSEAGWFDEIPEHWGLLQARRLFSQIREPARESDGQLSASQKYGVLPQRLFMELEDQKVALALTGLSGFKHVEREDFVISLRSFEGGIERSTYAGCVSPAYTVLRPVEAIESRFWGYLLKSKGFVAALQSATDGIRDGKTISYQQFGHILVPLLPLTEQGAIAAFLDGETSKIDALVTEQRRLMELLKEKRQAAISHAVTRGLNAHAPMKPSGIEWIGDIPAHWRVWALKRLARGSPKSFTDGDWIEAEFITSDGIRLIQTGNVGIGTYKEQGFRYISASTFRELGCTEVNPGDVLICRLDGPVGRGCLAPDLGVSMITSVDNAVLRCADDVHPEFVVAILSSGPWLSWIDAVCRVGGGFRLRVSRSQLGEVRVPVPPFDEQVHIVQHLRSQMIECDALATEAQRAVDLLLERRSALISAAVTGQIDVRQVAVVDDSARRSTARRADG